MFACHFKMNKDYKKSYNEALKKLGEKYDELVRSNESNKKRYLAPFLEIPNLTSQTTYIEALTSVINRKLIPEKVTTSTLKWLQRHAFDSALAIIMQEYNTSSNSRRAIMGYITHAFKNLPDNIDIQNMRELLMENERLKTMHVCGLDVTHDEESIVAAPKTVASKTTSTKTGKASRKRSRSRSPPQRRTPPLPSRRRSRSRTPPLPSRRRSRSRTPPLPSRRRSRSPPITGTRNNPIYL
jgi:hypothetical protein